MRALLVAASMMMATPVLATECRYFTLDNSISFFQNDEDLLVEIHWLHGAQETCDLTGIGEAMRFRVTCDSWSDYITYESEEPGSPAHFMGRRWQQECFEHV